MLMLIDVLLKRLQAISTCCSPDDVKPAA